MSLCVELKNVNKRFDKKEVIKNLSMELVQGEIYGLLGPSGCGKTTLVKIIAGLIIPNSGDVKVNNYRMPNPKVMFNVGYMSQSDALYLNLTAKDNLKFFGRLYGLKGKLLNDRIKHVCNIVGLKDELNIPVRKYSGGMKKRLSLAITILPSPKVLLLDEPTVGIDPILRESIWNELHKICKEGTTILITTHVMDEAKKCHRLGLMRQGSILARGSIKEILNEAQAQDIEEAFIKLSKGGE